MNSKHSIVKWLLALGSLGMVFGLDYSIFSHVHYTSYFAHAATFTIVALVFLAIPQLWIRWMLSEGAGTSWLDSMDSTTHDILDTDEIKDQALPSKVADRAEILFSMQKADRRRAHNHDRLRLDQAERTEGTVPSSRKRWHEAFPTSTSFVDDSYEFPPTTASATPGATPQLVENSGSAVQPSTSDDLDSPIEPLDDELRSPLERALEDRSKRRK